MNFSYGDAFGEFPATAYESLLLDAMHGDLTLFNRRDAVDLSWQILEPVLEGWQATRDAASFPELRSWHVGAFTRGRASGARRAQLEERCGPRSVRRDALGPEP